MIMGVRPPYRGDGNLSAVEYRCFHLFGILNVASFLPEVRLASLKRRVLN